MRTYIVILSDIPNQSCDYKFANRINESKFEWWRRTPLCWVIATPDIVSTNQIISIVVESYGPIFSTVLEVSIKDVGGVYPSTKKEIKDIPFAWFNIIKDKNFIPSWEKETKKDK